MTPMPWFERRFTFDLPVSCWPNVLERLRGTPARVEDRLREVPAGLLRMRPGDSWSIQENVGHLLDLEAVCRARVDDYVKGEAVLRTADLANQATVRANHNAEPIESIVRRFRASRAELVRTIAALDQEVIGRSAIHPRLQEPMRLLDMMIFMAEHDDHHMARVTELIATLPPAP
jgi:hypothetical protein